MQILDVCAILLQVCTCKFYNLHTYYHNYMHKQSAYHISFEKYPPVSNVFVYCVKLKFDSKCVKY